jgi:hypothetical protein
MLKKEASRVAQPLGAPDDRLEPRPVRRRPRLLRESGTAARLLSYSLALYEEIGTREAWVTAFREEMLATIRSQLDSAALAEA